MVKPPPKMTKLVVSAIRNLRDVQGSTTKDILNYVMREYNSEPTLERRLRAALKRGLEYGILQKKGAHYLLNTDLEILTDQGPMERGGRRRRRRGRKGKKGGKRGRGRRRRGGRRRKGRGKSRGKRRRRSGKRRHGRRSKKRAGVDDIDMLSKEPLEAVGTRPDADDVGQMYERPRTDTDGVDQTYERPRSRSRSRQSRSRSRTPSHSRSSGSSDREGADERRQHD